MDAFVAAIKESKIVADFTISAFHEHSIGSGSDTDAMAYIELTLIMARNSGDVEEVLMLVEQV